MATPGRPPILLFFPTNSKFVILVSGHSTPGFLILERRAYTGKADLHLWVLSGGHTSPSHGLLHLYESLEDLAPSAAHYLTGAVQQ